MAAFKARFTIIDGELDELQVWDDALTPTDHGKRSVREWVTEHIYTMGEEERLDMLDLPKIGAFEALLEGDINGQWTGAPWDGQEWDEQIDVIKLEKQPLPEEWFNPQSSKEVSDGE